MTRFPSAASLLTGGVRVERGGSLIRQRSFSFPYAALAFAYFACERGRPIPAVTWRVSSGPCSARRRGDCHSGHNTQTATRTRSTGSRFQPAGGRPGMYELDAPSDTWVDIEAAAAAIHDAEGELRAGRPAGAFGPSAVAHHIARRPFLLGEGHWVDAQRDGCAVFSCARWNAAARCSCGTAKYCWPSRRPKKRSRSSHFVKPPTNCDSRACSAGECRRCQARIRLLPRDPRGAIGYRAVIADGACLSKRAGR